MYVCMYLLYSMYTYTYKYDTGEFSLIEVDLKIFPLFFEAGEKRKKKEKEKKGPPR